MTNEEAHPEALQKDHKSRHKFSIWVEEVGGDDFLPSISYARPHPLGRRSCRGDIKVVNGKLLIYRNIRQALVWEEEKQGLGEGAMDSGSRPSKVRKNGKLNKSLA